jgi:hypothetical protein
LSQSQATEQPLGTKDLAVENKNRSGFLSTVQNGPEKEDRISPKCETTTAAGMAKKHRVRGCVSMEVCGAHQDKPLRCPSHVRARPLKQPRVQVSFVQRRICKFSNHVEL